MSELRRHRHRGCILIWWCEKCSHWHGRLTRGCMQPGCRCEER